MAASDNDDPSNYSVSSHDGRHLIFAYHPDYDGVLLAGNAIGEMREGPNCVSIQAAPFGRIRVDFQTATGGGSASFPGINCRKDEPVVMEVMVVGSTVRFWVNSNEYCEQDKDVIEVRALAKKFPLKTYQPYARAIFRDDLPHADRRFLSLLERMEEKIGRAQEADVLEAISHLRLLLIEGFANEVNRTRRLKLQFVAEPFGFTILPEDPRAASCGDLYFRAANPQALSLRQFLDARAVLYFSKYFSVADVIKFASNVLGVHHISVEPERHPLGQLLDLYDHAKRDRMPSLFMTMASIVFVALDGLRPLAEAVAHRDHITS